MSARVFAVTIERTESRQCFRLQEWSGQILFDCYSLPHVSVALCHNYISSPARKSDRSLSHMQGTLLALRVVEGLVLHVFELQLHSVALSSKSVVRLRTLDKNSTKSCLDFNSTGRERGEMTEIIAQLALNRLFFQKRVKVPESWRSDFRE